MTGEVLSPQERRERDAAWWRYHYGVNNLAEWEAKLAARLAGDAA